MQVLLKYPQRSDRDIYGVSLGDPPPISLLLGLVSSTYFGPPYALLHFSPYYKPPVGQLQRPFERHRANNGLESREDRDPSD
jgi:hypothetical protein